MRLARENGIKVLLDGQGADEVLPGYHYYIPLFVASLLKEGHPLRALKSLVRMAGTGVLSATESTSLVLAKSLYHALGLKGFRGTEASKILRPEFILPPAEQFHSHFQLQSKDDVFNSLQSLLRHEDRNAMAFSVEARTPFLDYRLVDLFMAMPGEWKIRDGWTKPFLRDAMAGILPERVRLRVDKKGFVTPEPAWYAAELQKIHTTLMRPDSPLLPWVSTERMKNWLWARRSRGYHSLIWRLLCVHFWMERFKLR